MLSANSMSPTSRMKRNADISDQLLILLNQYNAAEPNEKPIINKAIKDLIKNRPADKSIKIISANFSNLDLSGLNLSKCSFTHSSFENVNLSDCDLRAVDFSYSRISNVQFNGSDLREAQFLGRDRKNKMIVCADFSAANCEDTDFTASDLRKSTFNKETIVIHSKYKNAWLSASILEILLPYAKCDKNKKAQLSLDGCSLQNENLTSMDLSNTYLIDIYFSGTILKNTRFNNSDIRGSIFTKAVQLDTRQIVSCFNKDKAHFANTAAVKIKESNKATAGIKKISSFFFPIPETKTASTLKRKREETSDMGLGRTH